MIFAPMQTMERLRTMDRCDGSKPSRVCSIFSWCSIMCMPNFFSISCITSNASN
jgi:hypothetical protein